jgi:hypothetical protein
MRLVKVTRNFLHPLLKIGEMNMKMSCYDKKKYLKLITNNKFIFEFLKQSILTLGFIVTCFVSVNFSQDNGIGVSDPKIFDNRSLMIMLEELNKQLQSIKVIDQKSLLDSLGLSQGYQSSDISRSFEFGMAPIPALKTTRTPDAEGNLTTSEEVTDKKEFSGKTPTLPDLMTAPKYEPKFGVNAEDLLSQQIDLTYKIFNLRMLLERSISDRLITDKTIPENPDSTDLNGSKLQAVVGFNVRLNPPTNNKDMAAFVEVTIERCENAACTIKKPISLVAMMPQEKTYNTSALSTKSNAFGGSAVFKIFTVGYSERRRGQTFYLYQDADTITFQPMNQIGDISNISPTFGWEFRPVLGRRSISPGERPLFAVISLDKRDLLDNKDLSKLKVSVRTYWKKYDRKTLTVKSEEVNARSFEYNNTVVPTTTRFQNNLKPLVNKFSFNQLDDRNVVVSVDGENFFTGTNILIGNSVFDNPANGLTIKSDQSLQIRTTLEAISSGDLVINGRYGTSQPIAIERNSLNVKDIELNSFTVKSLSYKTTRLELTLINKDVYAIPTVAADVAANGNLSPDDITKYGIPPILKINNFAVNIKNRLQPSNCNFLLPDGTLTKRCVLAIVDVPSSIVKDDTVISFKVPLLGAGWTSSRQLYYDALPTNVKLSKLSEDKTKTVYAITGNYLKDIVIVSNPPITEISRDSTLIVFQVSKKVLDKLKNIVIQYQRGEPIILTMPDSAPKVPTPKVTETDPPQVFVKSSKTIKFKGEGLSAIKQALFEGQDLQIIKKSDTEITVLLTREVTKEAGEVEIILKNDKDTISGKVLILEPSKETKP